MVKLECDIDRIYTIYKQDIKRQEFAIGFPILKIL